MQGHYCVPSVLPLCLIQPLTLTSPYGMSTLRLMANTLPTCAWVSHYILGGGEGVCQERGIRGSGLRGAAVSGYTLVVKGHLS